MDINNLNQEIENIFNKEAKEQQIKHKGSKKLFRTIEENLYRIVVQNINGKMGKC